MSDIKITSIEAVYILQALNHTILDIAYAYKDLDLETCTQDELKDFSNEQIFLKDLIESRNSVMESYKALNFEQSNLVQPDLLELPDEAKKLLEKFFPKKKT